MNKVKSFTFTILLAVSVMAGRPVLLVGYDADSHLEEYSQYNVSYHDNIDDETDSHVHKHKHSEDGQEHEHHHEHSQITYTDSVKIVPTVDLDIFVSFSFENISLFGEKFLISDSFLKNLFRPPIV